MSYDTIVLGSGLNSLVSAAYLGRAGKVLVLEARSDIGGRIGSTAPFEGFKVCPLTGFGARLRPRILKDLHLEYYGLDYLAHDPVTLSLAHDLPPLILWRDTARAAESIGRYSPKDARALADYRAFLARTTEFAEQLLDLTPAPLESNEVFPLLDLANLGVKFRSMGKQEMHRLMRVATMSADDMLSEWFESERVRGALALPGVAERFCGPRSPGTAATLLYHELGGPIGAPKGGFGAVAEALASVIKDAGSEIRPNSRVTSIVIKHGRACGVKLESGEVIEARRVVSGLDPKATLLQLVDPLELSPSFSHRVTRIRSRGVTAILNLALDAVPTFTGVDDEQALRGRIVVGNGIEALERAFDPAKYGKLPDRPALELVIPTLADPSLAPFGKHLMQIRASWIPYHLRDQKWNDKLKAQVQKNILAVLAEVCPGLSDRIVGTQLLTPPDIEAEYGLSEGHLHHGEHALHQLWFGRPVPGSCNYTTPVEELYLCGAGTHPGGALTGANGANAAEAIISAGQTGVAPALRKAKAAVTTPVGAGLAVSAGLALLGAGLAVGSAWKAVTGKKGEKSQDTAAPDEPGKEA